MWYNLNINCIFYDLIGTRGGNICLHPNMKKVAWEKKITVQNQCFGKAHIYYYFLGNFDLLHSYFLVTLGYCSFVLATFELLSWYFGVTLELLSGYFGVNMKSLKKFWLHWSYLRATFWLLYGYFWVTFGYIEVT